MSPVFNNDHNSLVNLAVGDKHTQHVLLAGRSGGQVIIGSTVTAEGLTLQTNSAADNGTFTFKNSATTRATLTAAGQFALPITGSAAGVLVGGDALLYRIAADRFASPDAMSIGGALVAGGTGAISDADYVFEVVGRAKMGSTVTDDDIGSAGFSMSYAFTGSADYARAFSFQGICQAEASVASFYGFTGFVMAAPPSGVTISQMEGFTVNCYYNSTVGAVTTGFAINAAGPSFNDGSSIRPTNQVGLNISNQGSTGMTQAIGIAIVKPTNATNNYYMSFDTAAAEVNATIGSAGYIPVVVAGVARKIYYT